SSQSDPDPTDDPTTPPRTGSVTPTRSSGSPSPTGSVSIQDARKIADQYFDDITSGDSDHATTLLCKAQVAPFKENLAGPRNDFDFTFTNVDYLDGEVTARGTTAQYDVQGFLTADPKVTVDVTLTFTVIKESGPKLCGESTS
ncbi:MAG: hypothetical protein JWN61_1646, partial [Pseudonocardiales bacterium]|nr:hypothetical protein [Pseudonocardiales bacterium]